MSTYVVAEGGACHDGDRGKQLKLMDAAAAAGCNAYKTQWTSDPEKMAGRRGKAAEDGYVAVYRRYLTWPKEWHGDFANECYVRGLDYMCTVYLAEDVEVVAPHVRHAKIASFEASDRALGLAWRSATQRWDANRHIMVSVGMGAEWREDRVSGGSLSDLPHGRVRRLHCVSSYPAPSEELQLSRLWLGEDGDLLDGFSDHSEPRLTWTGALAVAAGAVIIEAHFRLYDTDPKNPDYPHAMTLRELKEYVGQIRFAERCLGDGCDQMQPSELAMARYRVQ